VPLHRQTKNWQDQGAVPYKKSITSIVQFRQMFFTKNTRQKKTKTILYQWHQTSFTSKWNFCWLCNKLKVSERQRKSYLYCCWAGLFKEKWLRNWQAAICINGISEPQLTRPKKPSPDPKTFDPVGPVVIIGISKIRNPRNYNLEYIVNSLFYFYICISMIVFIVS